MATNAIIAMASLVVSVILLSHDLPWIPDELPGESNARAHYGQEATPPLGLDAG